MRNLLPLLGLILLAIGCETNQEAARGDTAEVVVPLEKVPAKVRQAGEQAVPGIVFTRVERELEGGVWVYDLEGTANGVAYEVEVTADGKVLEIEKGDADEDENDEDEDDEDED